jgi:hypothetical protein
MGSNIKKIGVLTSGGDAPGMNAAIRAVVRSCAYHKIACVGIYRGYEGLIEGDFEDLDARSVKNIINRGGTFLKSARSKGFFTKEGRQESYNNLKKEGVDALVVIGGDGTFTGAIVFNDEHNFPIVGIPGTIDNDINGTDFTIGYDTALNTVVEAAYEAVSAYDEVISCLTSTDEEIAYEAVKAYDEFNTFVIAFLASEADPLKAATDELIVWSVVVNDPLSVAIGATDEPLIFATNMFLASDADPLNTVDEIAYEAVSAYDEVISCLTSTDEEIAYEAVKAYDELNTFVMLFLASEADPLNVATEALIA